MFVECLSVLEGFLLELVDIIECSFFYIWCALLFTVGCWAHVCVLLFQRHAILRAACVLGSYAMLLLLFGCGVVLGSDGACLFRFYPYIAVHFRYVYACVCSECLRCAACRASLSPLVFMGLDVDYWLQL